MNTTRTEEMNPLLKYHENYKSTSATSVTEVDIIEDDTLLENEILEQDIESDNRVENKSVSWPGYLFCILSGLCFIACNVCIKLASTEFPVSSWCLLCVRSGVQVVCMLPLLCRAGQGMLGPQGDLKTKLRIVAQATISGCLLLCYFEGIKRLPLGDFGAIAFSSPAFTMVLSIFMLKEHCGVYRCFIAIILTFGVVMISRPPTLFPEDILDGRNEGEVKSIDYLGIMFALTGSALSAWVTIIARQLTHIHFSIQIFWFSLGGGIISLLGIFLIDTSSMFSRWTVSTWLLAAGQGVLGLVGTVLILLALQYISPTKNKVIRSFQVVASYIIQVTAFGTIPHSTDYVGAVMIVMAVLGITLEDIIMKAIKAGGRCRYI